MLDDPALLTPGKVGRAHPSTSTRAAFGSMPKFGSQRWHVLAELARVWPEGATAAELADVVRLSRNQTATRLMELREGGWVERVLLGPDTYLTRPTGPSDEGIVQRLTRAGADEFPYTRRAEVIPVDLAALRANLNAAPDAVKVIAARHITASGHRLDDVAWWDAQPGDLVRLVNAIALDALDEHGIAFAVPIDTEVFYERGRALPVDLQDEASASLKPYGVPHTKHPGEWTPEHAEHFDIVVGKAEAEAAARMRRVHELLDGASDETRHAVIAQLTAGEVESSKLLTAPELLELEARVGRHRAGGLAYVEQGYVDSATGELLGRYVPDWRSFAKANGTTATALSKRMREVARGLGITTAPDKIADVADRRLVAAMFRDAEVARAVERLHDAGLTDEPSTAGHPAAGGAQTPVEAAQTPARLAVVPSVPETAEGPTAPAEVELLVPVPVSKLDAVLAVLR